jgi:hypothetical protein
MAAKRNLPTSVQKYNESLTAYLEAARAGTSMQTLSVDSSRIWTPVKAESDIGKITIEFSPEQSETLVGIVADHTRKLAEANQLALADLEERVPELGSGTIIDLRSYLQIQGRVFSGVA